MSKHLLASLLAAAALHAVVLFGFRFDSTARPLPGSEQAIEVNLVAAAPAAAPLVEPAPPEQEPEPASEPIAVPFPSDPDPEPVPETVSEQIPESEPPPEPERAPPERTVEVVKPRPETRKQRREPGKDSPKSVRRSQASPSGAEQARGPTTSAHPRYRSNPQPNYPPEARRQRQEGLVLILVSVNAGGRPTGVSLARSSGFGSLDQAALQAVRNWTFEPARAASVPVASKVTVPVRFNLRR